MNSRYDRQTILPQIGKLGQEKLLQTKVLLIGAGGLGAAILPYLVAAGIGEIGIVDADKVELSNLQRQVIYNADSVGKSKALEAKKMAESLNSDCKITAYETLFCVNNALQLVESYDIIVDGTDNLATKYLINDACVVQNKPFVYGSVYRFEGQVSVFNYKNGPSYRCLFPDENRDGMSCVDAGVLGISVGLIGMLQANEVLKIVLSLDEVLSGKLLIYNCLNNQQEKFSVAKKTFLIQNRTAFLEKYFTSITSVISIETVEILKYLNAENCQFLDVRNKEEKPEINILNSLHIPLKELEVSLKLLNSSKEILVFCQSGIRSKIAAELLLKNNFKNVKSIEGGALAIHTLLNSTEVSYS